MTTALTLAVTLAGVAFTVGGSLADLQSTTARSAQRLDRIDPRIDQVIGLAAKQELILQALDRIERKIDAR